MKHFLTILLLIFLASPVHASCMAGEVSEFTGTLVSVSAKKTDVRAHDYCEVELKDAAGKIYTGGAKYRDGSLCTLAAGSAVTFKEAPPCCDTPFVPGDPEVGDFGCVTPKLKPYTGTKR